MSSYSPEVLVLDEIRVAINDLALKVESLEKTLDYLSKEDQIKGRVVKIFQGDYEDINEQVNTYSLDIEAIPIEVSISTYVVDGEVFSQAIVIYETLL